MQTTAIKLNIVHRQLVLTLLNTAKLGGTVEVAAHVSAIYRGMRLARVQEEAKALVEAEKAGRLAALRTEENPDPKLDDFQGLSLSEQDEKSDMVEYRVSRTALSWLESKCGAHDWSKRTVKDRDGKDVEETLVVGADLLAFWFETVEVLREALRQKGEGNA